MVAQQVDGVGGRVGEGQGVVHYTLGGGIRISVRYGVGWDKGLGREEDGWGGGRGETLHIGGGV